MTAASRSASLEILDHAPVASNPYLPPHSMGASKKTQVVSNSKPSVGLSESSFQRSGQDVKGKQASQPRPSIIRVLVEHSTSEDDMDKTYWRRRSGSEQSREASAFRKRNRYTASSVRSRKRVQSSHAGSRLHSHRPESEAAEASDNDTREIAEADAERRAVEIAVLAKAKHRTTISAPLMEKRVQTLKQPRQRQTSSRSGSGDALSSAGSRAGALPEATSLELLASDNDFSLRVSTQSARQANGSTRKRIAMGSSKSEGSARKTSTALQMNGIHTIRDKHQRNDETGTEDDDSTSHGGKKKAGDAVGRQIGTPNGAGTDKRYQRQISGLKRKLEEREDQFNELSSAHEVSKQESRELKDALEQVKAELKRKSSSSDADAHHDAEGGSHRQSLFEQIDRLQQEVFLLRSGNGLAELADRRELQELRRRHAAEVKRRDEHLLRAEQAAQNARSDTQAELNKRTAQFNVERNALVSELQQLQSEYRILLKTSTNDERKRALEHQLHWAREEIVALQVANQKLLLNHNGASAPSCKSGVNGGIHSEGSTAIVAATPLCEEGQLRHNAEQVQQAESYITALTEQKDRHIRQLQKELSQRDQSAHDKFKIIEMARTKIEIKYESALADKARIDGDLKAARQNEQQLYKIQPEYARLKLAQPRLQALLDEAQEHNTRLSQESEALRGERALYVKYVADARSEAQSLRADLARITKQLAAVRTDRAQQKPLHLRSSEMDQSPHHRGLEVVGRKLPKVEQRGSASRNVNEHASDELSTAEEDVLNEADDGDLDTVRVVRRQIVQTPGIMLDSKECASWLTSGPAISSNGQCQLSDHDSDAVMAPAWSGHHDVDSSMATFAEQPAPPINPALAALRQRSSEVEQTNACVMDRIWSTSTRIQWPTLRRVRRPSTKVPEDLSRIYVRSECHTPYVPGETVDDTDDEFLEWESEAYERTQMGNPDREEALVNTCWNRHILDARGTRVRSDNLAFCSTFAEDYAHIIHEHGAKDAFLKHVLELVKLNQLTADEGGTVVTIFHESLSPKQ